MADDDKKDKKKSIVPKSIGSFFPKPKKTIGRYTPKSKDKDKPSFLKPRVTPANKYSKKKTPTRRTDVAKVKPKARPTSTPTRRSGGSSIGTFIPKKDILKPRTTPANKYSSRKINKPRPVNEPEDFDFNQFSRDDLNPLNTIKRAGGAVSTFGQEEQIEQPMENPNLPQQGGGEDNQYFNEAPTREELQQRLDVDEIINTGEAANMTPVRDNVKFKKLLKDKYPHLKFKKDDDIFNVSEEDTETKPQDIIDQVLIDSEEDKKVFEAEVNKAENQFRDKVLASASPRIFDYTQVDEAYAYIQDGYRELRELKDIKKNIRSEIVRQGGGHIPKSLLTALVAERAAHVNQEIDRITDDIDGYERAMKTQIEYLKLMKDDDVGPKYRSSKDGQALFTEGDRAYYKPIEGYEPDEVDVDRYFDTVDRLRATRSSDLRDFLGNVDGLAKKYGINDLETHLGTFRVTDREINALKQFVDLAVNRLADPDADKDEKAALSRMLDQLEALGR